jgi:hypothetical protein
VSTDTASTDVIAKGELIWVPLDRLVPNPWNPNRMDSFMYEKELASIRKFGMASPIVARAQGNVYEIIDGEHRLKALDQLGHTEAPVWNLGPLPDPQAKQLTIVLNETKGSPEKQKLTELLQDLLKSEPTEDLLGVLPYSKEAFAELVNLPAFDWEEFENQTPRKIEDSWVERIYRLPHDAAAVLDRAIAKAKDEEPIPDGIALERIAADYLGGA